MQEVSLTHASSGRGASEPVQSSGTIERIIRERVEAKRSAGAVAAVVDPQGTRVAAHGDPGPGQPPLDTTSVFEIGSVTKVFTATLLADMALRGEVALDEPVSRLLPPTVAVPRRGARQIELLDLATNTSGLPRLPTNVRLTDRANPLANYSEGQLYEFLSTHTLSRDIGAEYEYSNLGFGLLGHALAAHARKSFEGLIRERILEPLGLTMTGITPTPQMEARLALPHDDRGELVPSWDYGVLDGAGAIRSNMADMLVFAAANLDPSRGQLHQAMAETHVPRRDAVAGMRIGLGWHIKRLFDRDIVWHSGETAGSRAFVGLDSEAARAVIVLSNSSSPIEDIGFHLLDERAELAEAGPEEIDLPPEVLDRYVGIYEQEQGTVTVTRTNAGLSAAATGLGTAPLHAASDTEFYVTVIPVQTRFELDATGGVTGLVLTFGGKESRARKIS